MKKKLVFLGILMLFVALLVLAEEQEKEISVDEAMKYFCITWINPDYYENDFYAGIKIMNKDGTFKFYQNETSEDPTSLGEYKIDKSWIDKDGNVWLNVLFDEGFFKKYALAKISDDGNTLEVAFDYNAYPTLDPDTWPTYIMYRK